MYSISEISQLTGLSEGHLSRRGGKSPLSRVKETVTWTEIFNVNEDTGEEMLTEEGYGYLLDYLSCCGKDGTMTYEEWQRSISLENDQPVALVPVEPYQPELSPVPDAHQAINNLKSQLLIMADEVGVQNKQFGAELAHRMFTPLAESFTVTSEEILKRSFGGNQSA
ncbi:MAG: hypothetical protein WAN66_23770 [Limnoraphis robusta]|uniref:Uncharacterized protein n=1 Tax=Limnoraphis robusta CS-951 TaxID=1637645 RepID=A0A0F5YEY2_9CYAN|nr:hypothetical protein [Limnoraphis robusta]KKD37469.2 hypothetical protein WN50_14170 [Limnoraphis robusta CS-951]KKD38979.2 hypothetical protein WN50_05955 [Limnoraphis robusta CS-951]